MSSPLRILLVDETPESAIAIQGTGSPRTLDVQRIGSPAQLEAALDAGGFDAVVTERTLAWGDGALVLKAVKARHPACPVIMLTASGSEEIAVLALKTGFDDYLSKQPSHVARLPGIVEEAVARRRGAHTWRKDESGLKAEMEELLPRLQTILQRMPIGCIVNDADFRFTYWNPAAERIFGYSFEEVRGKHPFGVIIPPSSQPLMEDIFRRVASGDLLANGVGENVTKDGRTIVCAWTNTPLHDQGGSFAGLLSMCEDITQRQRAEEQLRLSQRIEAVGRLAGGIAHDFNNLLNVVTGYSEMLLKELPAEGKSRRRAEHILTAALKAADLTRQLLAFSRQQILKPRVFDLNPAVVDLRRTLRPLVREDIELVIRTAPALGLVRADPGQIDQVLMNLAVNAIDAMPEGGTIVIETANEEFDEAAARLHAPARPGHYILLALSDTGPGMDAETQARIFEPFFTTRSQGRGTGLGLSTVYGIVKQSDGFIWVDSEIGRGTSFKIYLPRVAERPEHPAREGPQTPVMGGTETILVVEDQELALEMFQEALTSRGYQVLKATDGVAGLELAENHQGPIHLLLTDVVLPRMGGRQMAERVTLRHPEARVLFMSGYSSETISRHGVLEPGIELIEKPFGPEQLNRRVREILDRA